MVLLAGFWCSWLFGCIYHGNFNALDAFTSEEANAASSVLNDTFAVSVDSEVAAELCALTSTLGQTNLANDNVTSTSLLTTVQFNTKSLTWRVA